MPWLAQEFTPTVKLADADIPFGGVGTLRWYRPDAADVTDTHKIAIPRNLHSINGQASWSSDGNAAYDLGGFTDNAVVTRHWQLWPMGIRAPNRLPDVALSAGPGITANVICYLRWYDALTGERSPLSGASATLTAVNQSITYSNLDDQEAPDRATHIEGWESRDGGLPRLVFRRQIGVVSVVHHKPLGDLGEAETSSWSKAPRCRYGVFWHDRLVMAGDDQNPTRIYIMAIGFPERWEGLFVDMKSRAAVTGLTEINGRLLVFGATVTEGISGWTEDDIRIDIVQPHLGLVSHFALIQTDTYVWIMTEEQPFLSDGSSWFPMGRDIKPTYAQDFKDNRKAFQQMFVDHHPGEHVIRWYLGPGLNFRDYKPPADPEAAGSVWLVADYETVLPQEGGGFDQPRWSYDFTANGRACAALMAVPGGTRRDPFTGGLLNGAIFRDGGRLPNVLMDQTEFGADDDENGIAQLPNVMEILTGALQFNNIGGDLRAFAMQMTDFSLIFNQGGTIYDDNDSDQTKHDLPWTLTLYAGDIECASAPFPFQGENDPSIVYIAEATALNPPAFTYTAPGADVPVLANDADGSLYRLQPVWTHYWRNLPAVVGQAFKVRLSMANPQQAKFAGFVAWWKQGQTNRQHGKTWFVE